MLSTIPQWWSRKACEAGLSTEWQDWQLALPAPPEPLSGCPRDDLIHADAAAIGEAYTQALDSTTRLREGRHYTPRLLADVLWRDVAEPGVRGGLVVDPACGAGALLQCPLGRLVESAHHPEEVLEAAPGQISGTDTDPLAVWLGHALLGSQLLPLWNQIPEHQRRALPTLLRVGDGLAPADDHPHIVILNPPFGRVRLDDSDRQRWQDILYGHANRFGLFLHAAINRVASGGFVAAVIPTGFLGGAYYQRLRRFIAEHAPLTRLTFVDARAGVFAGDVLQETCLAVFHKGAKARRVFCSRLVVNGAPTRTSLPSAPMPRDPSLPWLLPRRTTDGSLLATAARLTARLPDYGWKARTGPLVWNRHKSQILPSPAPNGVRIVWAADLDGGTVSPDRARDTRRWIALRPQDDFMRLSEPAILVQRTTAPEQPRRLVPARLCQKTLVEWGGAVVVENHVNVLRCSDRLSPLSMKLLHELLRTPTFDRLYRCLTGTVAVSAYELEALPLPPPEALTSWQKVPFADLPRVVARYYGDEAP